MNRPHSRGPLPNPTIRMTEGWHCLHIYYSVNRQAIAAFSETDRAAGREELLQALSTNRDDRPERMQLSLVSGHKADLAMILLDPDPLVIDAVHQDLRSTRLGACLEPNYSFVSITEVSEYVPTAEQYEARLRREGTSEEAVAAKLGAYSQRLPAMNKQRLYPDIPALPVVSFYPMNKIRDPDANWYTTPFSARSDMMAEHAKSGIAYAGRVSQLITASTGFDEWEWGVTLWARAPEHIKDIVYTMRFDKASARYAEFGPFYISYVVEAEEAIERLRL